MQASRDGLTFYLTRHADDCQPGGLVHLFVPNVDDWYAEFQRKGLPVEEAPNEGLEGPRMMTVVDPDGNQLRICTRLKT